MGPTATLWTTIWLAHIAFSCVVTPTIATAPDFAVKTSNVVLTAAVGAMKRELLNSRSLRRNSANVTPNSSTNGTTPGPAATPNVTPNGSNGSSNGSTNGTTPGPAVAPNVTPNGSNGSTNGTTPGPAAAPNVTPNGSSNGSSNGSTNGTTPGPAAAPNVTPNGSNGTAPAPTPTPSSNSSNSTPVPIPAPTPTSNSSNTSNPTPTPTPTGAQTPTPTPAPAPTPIATAPNVTNTTPIPIPVPIPTSTPIPTPTPTAAPLYVQVAQQIIYTDLNATEYIGATRTAFENGYCATARLCDSSTYEYYAGVTLASSASSARRAAAVTYNTQLSGANSSISTKGVSANDAAALQAATVSAANHAGITVPATVGNIAPAAVIPTPTPTPTAPTDTTTGSSSAISTGLIVGIVVGVGVFVAGIAVYLTCKMKKRTKPDAANETEEKGATDLAIDHNLGGVTHQKKKTKKFDVTYETEEKGATTLEMNPVVALDVSFSAVSDGSLTRSSKIQSSEMRPDEPRDNHVIIEEVMDNFFATPVAVEDQCPYSPRHQTAILTL